MRYQNWDVLLFPSHSRIPVQEFGTACHVITDQSSLAASKWGPSQDAFLHASNFESMNKTPILTCFVSSLPSGTPFRISIHSWTKPGPSNILKSRKGAELAAFQARVFVDGVLQSTRTYKEGTSWPEVIDLKDIPIHGSTSELIFPAFHHAMLQQPQWDPAEPLGRIQLVLTEGVLKEVRAAEVVGPKVTFEGVREVVAFAFQHAPQDVLEYSGIAWPNARLFENKANLSRRQSTIGTRSGTVAGQEVPAYSPTRIVSGSRNDIWTRMAKKGETASKDVPFRTASGRDSRLVGVAPFGTPGMAAFSGVNDPFLGPGPESSLGWRSSARKTSTDETMPDYASHTTDHSRADTDMSITWPRRDFQKHMDEAAVDEIIEALSPSKKGQLLNALSPQKSSSSGIQPPINTPKTAEASQQGSPAEHTPREGLSEAAAGNSKQDGGRAMKTRSMKTAVPETIIGGGRARSSSGSSKRKRSTSDMLADQDAPATARKDPLITSTPSVPTSRRKRISLPTEKSSPDSDKEIKVESRKSSANGGVLIN